MLLFRVALVAGLFVLGCDSEPDHSPDQDPISPEALADASPNIEVPDDGGPSERDGFDASPQDAAPDDAAPDDAAPDDADAPTLDPTCYLDDPTDMTISIGGIDDTMSFSGRISYIAEDYMLVQPDGASESDAFLANEIDLRDLFELDMEVTFTYTAPDYVSGLACGFEVRTIRGDRGALHYAIWHAPDGCDASDVRFLDHTLRIGAPYCEETSTESHRCGGTWMRTRRGHDVEIEDLGGTRTTLEPLSTQTIGALQWGLHEATTLVLETDRDCVPPIPPGAEAHLLVAERTP